MDSSDQISLKGEKTPEQIAELEAKKKAIEEGKSLIDPTRDTVGKIYRDAQIECEGDLEKATVRDINDMMIKGFIEDINSALKSDPFNGEPFYVQITEKWDYQMKHALRRMVNKWKLRPYPEAGTTVFWTNPKTQEVKYCWDLPHPTEMDNILMNELLFPHETVTLLKAWKLHQLEHFGFRKDLFGNWEANPHFQDKLLKTT